MELKKNFNNAYLPKSLDDIAFTYKADKSVLQNCVTGRNGFPCCGKNGILLVGDTGSGKSTLAKLLPDLFEQARTNGRWINASPSYHQISTGSNGVELIELIETNAGLNPLGDQFNYIILDEVDLLTPQAMSRLKSVMNIAFGSSIFIMTTNALAKVDKAVANRCNVIYLNHAPSTAWLPLYMRILSEHGITNISTETILNKIDMCNGSGRDVIESAVKVILDYDEGTESPVITLSTNVV